MQHEFQIEKRWKENSVNIWCPMDNVRESSAFERKRNFSRKKRIESFKRIFNSFDIFNFSQKEFFPKCDFTIAEKKDSILFSRQHGHYTELEFRMHI